MQAIEASFELELATDQVGGDTESMEILLVERTSDVSEPESLVRVAPRPAVITLTCVVEVVRHCWRM
jgi:hypothetical protein